MALYVEILGDNYHTSPIFCIGWGDDEHIYVAEPEVVFASDDFKNWAKEKRYHPNADKAKSIYKLAAPQILAHSPKTPLPYCTISPPLSLLSP